MTAADTPSPAADDTPLDYALAAAGPITPDRSAEARRHPGLLLAAVLAAAAALLIAVLGATLARGVQFEFDRAVLLALRHGGAPGVPVGPGWFEQAMLDITALGGGTVLTLVTLAAIGWLLLRRHVLTAALLAAGVVSGSLAIAAAKAIVGRVRPEFVDHLVEAGSASFPSGHSGNSAIVYATLALLLAQITAGRRERLYLAGGALLLVLLIGFSRMYLGVHFPSDVLAGWSFGLLWALGWWALGGWLRDRAGRRRAAAP